MLIACPYCGARDAQEFAYRGDATVRRPDPASPDAAQQFHDYVYLRDNPEGPHREMWHHAADGVLVDLLSHAADYFAIDDQLRHIESPTLIVQADPARGGVLSDAQAERAARLLPRGTWRQMPGAGHAIHATAPQEFVRQVREFTGVPPLR